VEPVVIRIGRILNRIDCRIASSLSIPALRTKSETKCMIQLIRLVFFK
jgi:hypothetical protein